MRILAGPSRAQSLEDMWGEELRFEKEGVMALIGMDADPGDRGPGQLEKPDEAGLLGRLEAGVGINAKHEKSLRFAAGEELDKIGGPGLGKKIEPLPASRMRR